MGTAEALRMHGNLLREFNAVQMDDSIVADTEGKVHVALATLISRNEDLREISIHNFYS